MCNHLVVLAGCQPRRFIGQCEHGNVHFAWDLITFHFSPTQFIQFTSMLRQWLDGDIRREQRTAHLCFVCDSNGAARLWIGPYCLVIQQRDLALLLHLSTAASARLNSANQPRQHPIDPFHDSFQPIAASDMSMRFVN